MSRLFYIQTDIRFLVLYSSGVNNFKTDQLTYVACTALGEEYVRAVIVKDFKTGKRIITAHQDEVQVI